MLEEDFCSPSFVCTDGLKCEPINKLISASKTNFCNRVEFSVTKIAQNSMSSTAY
jgi:hypothetical protein